MDQLLGQDGSEGAGFGLKNQHSSGPGDTAITSDNVGQLGQAWSIPTQDMVPGVGEGTVVPGETGAEATPES